MHCKLACTEASLHTFMPTWKHVSMRVSLHVNMEGYVHAKMKDIFDSLVWPFLWIQEIWFMDGTYCMTTFTPQTLPFSFESLHLLYLWSPNVIYACRVLPKVSTVHALNMYELEEKSRSGQEAMAQNHFVSRGIRRQAGLAAAAEGAVRSLGAREAMVAWYAAAKKRRNYLLCCVFFTCPGMGPAPSQGRFFCTDKRTGYGKNGERTT
jgi:hypothetical protein